MPDASERLEELPLRPALVRPEADSEGPLSPRSGPTKVVSIADPEISPNLPCLENSSSKQFSAGIARRLSGRPASNSSKVSLNGPASYEELPGPALNDAEPDAHDDGRHAHEKLLSEVSQWLQAEKAKRAAKKSSRHHSQTNLSDATIPRSRTSSQSSDSSIVSLDKLQRIIENNISSTSFGQLDVNGSGGTVAAPRRPSASDRPRRRSAMLKRAQSSDTEFYDGDIVVPSCDVILDNTKTLGCSIGGAAASASNLDLSKGLTKADRAIWLDFKTEILKLTHTLRLKGWRQVALDQGDELAVERLSGALTNAVYVVTPPEVIPQASKPVASGENKQVRKKKTPTRLLLRIYGPQVEHLIDRENELGILRRLSRKKIGPRLLGTFKNGRFEEYFASTTLTAKDLRMPETSKQIAKRMRELHEGVELLAREREEGAFVWRNWDKWVDRCGQVAAYLDAKSRKSGYFVCGVEWKVFKDMVYRYRKWLAEYYGDERHLAEKLVFAHNDTQYGNILRMQPVSSESPLLLPANTHKQLVVIDFEYASANTVGLEFANHFTEWCYNYHDEKAPHACHTERYPTIDEQRRFVRSYVSHRPQFNARASATPKLGPRSDTSSSIKEFMLDSRTPGGTTPGGYDIEEERRIEATEAEVDMLIKEARIWRVANSAQWVAWGIVQAKIPELEEIDGVIAPVHEHDASEPHHEHKDKRPEGLVAEALLHSDSHEELVKAEMAEADDGEDEFDYLGYTRERALFFWGDCVSLGLCKLEDLPEGIRGELKMVEY